MSGAGAPGALRCPHRSPVRSGQLLRHRRTELIIVQSPTDAAALWSDFAPRLREQAEAWGNALDETPMLLALWDRQPSFLETVIEQWNERGWTVEIVELKRAQSWRDC